MQDTTFLFLYPRKSLAEVDGAAASHGAAACCDAVGENGRRQMSSVDEDCVETTQTLQCRVALVDGQPLDQLLVVVTR